MPSQASVIKIQQQKGEKKLLPNLSVNCEEGASAALLKRPFRKRFFRVSFRLLIFIFIPHRASCTYGKHWNCFPDVLKTQGAFGFPYLFASLLS